jgi:hypothetical protein
MTNIVFGSLKDKVILKFKYMMLLLHLNGDFDDDLLLDTMELLVDL